MLTINTFEDKDLRRLSKSCVVLVCGKGGIIASHSQNVLGYPKCRTGISPGKAVSGIAPLTVSQPPVVEKGAATTTSSSSCSAYPATFSLGCQRLVVMPLNKVTTRGYATSQVRTR